MGTYRVVEHVWIPMRDGQRLSARLWIPDGPPAPAVLEYIPYRKRDRYRAADSYWGKRLATTGIAFARVDVRGSGDSEGVLTDEYAEPELGDGVTVIEWLAAQPWCSGSIGMRGISWGAINTLLIAARQPPALRAIVAIAGTDNRFTDDAHYVGGTLAHCNFEWGTSFKSVMAAPPDPEVVGEAWRAMWQQRLDASPPILAEWTSHPQLDDYWRGNHATPFDYKTVCVPAYLVGGWQDTYSNPISRLLEHLEVPRKALIGPWGHTYPYFAGAPAIDWPSEEIRWWRHWLADEDSGILEEPMLRAFLPYATARQAAPDAVAGRWIAEDSWPAKSISSAAWTLTTSGLGANGQMSAATGSDPSDPDAWTLSGAQVVGASKPDWLNRAPLEQSHDDQRSLTFDSAPLDEPVEILGHARLDIEVCSTRPIASLAARLCEVTRDNASHLVTWTLLNLTHRDGHEAPEPLSVGQPQRISLEMPLMAHRFGTGSRIRIALSQSLWPLAWPPPEPFELTLTPDNGVLTLPVRHAATDAEVALEPIDRQAEPPAEYAAFEADNAGHIRLRAESDDQHEITPIGTKISTHRVEASDITEGEPNSGRWFHQSRTRWQRGDWNCEVQVSCELTSTAEHFLVTERVAALQDNQVFFDRPTVRRVARHLG